MAVGTGRIGYVFLVDGKLRDWRLSKKASKSPERAAKQAKIWINNLEPDVVVTERIGEHSAKSARTRALIDAITDIDVGRKLLNVKAKRVCSAANKYEEATVLGEQFPEIQAWVPKKPRIWETEPRNTVYFEALALALQVFGPAGSDPYT
ncbi:MAG: hypothetical protein AAF530_19135 [Pseudomonadota bacterium]